MISRLILTGISLSAVALLTTTPAAAATLGPPVDYDPFAPRIQTPEEKRAARAAFKCGKTFITFPVQESKDKPGSVITVQKKMLLIIQMLDRTKLAEFRQGYPQYDDLDDATIADALYRKHYSDMPRAQFDEAIRAKSVQVGIGRASGPGGASTHPVTPETRQRIIDCLD